MNNARWALCNEGMLRIFKILSVLAIVRYLGPSSYGEYSLVFAFVTIFAVTIDFGFSSYIQYIVTKNKKILINIREIFYVKIIYCLTAALIVIFAIKIQNLSIPLAYLMLTNIVLLDILGLCFVILRGIDKFDGEFKYRLIYNILTMTLILTSLNIAPNAEVAVLVQIVSAALMLLILYFGFIKCYINFNRKIRLIKFNQFTKIILINPLSIGIPTAVLTAYSNLDVYLLSFVNDPKIVGIYSAVLKIILIAQLPTAIASQLIYKIIVSMKTEPETGVPKIRIMIEAMIAYSLLSTLIILINAKELISLVYGNTYLEGENVLSILILGLPAFLIYPLLIQIVTFGNKINSLTTAILASVISAIAMIYTIYTGCESCFYKAVLLSNYIFLILFVICFDFTYKVKLINNKILFYLFISIVIIIIFKIYLKEIMGFLSIEKKLEISLLITLIWSLIITKINYKKLKKLFNFI